MSNCLRASALIQYENQKSEKKKVLLCQCAAQGRSNKERALPNIMYEAPYNTKSGRPML